MRTPSTVARELEESEEPEIPAVRRLGSAAVFLLQTVASWSSGELSSPLVAAPDDAIPGVGQSHDALDEADDFQPAVTLIGGNLPGSAALAQQTIGREDAGRFSPSTDEPDHQAGDPGGDRGSIGDRGRRGDLARNGSTGR